MPSYYLPINEKQPSPEKISAISEAYKLNRALSSFPWLVAVGLIDREILCVYVKSEADRSRAESEMKGRAQNQWTVKVMSEIQAI